jgi:hypothetical protein
VFENHRSGSLGQANCSLEGSAAAALALHSTGSLFQLLSEQPRHIVDPVSMHGAPAVAAGHLPRLPPPAPQPGPVPASGVVAPTSAALAAAAGAAGAAAGNLAGSALEVVSAVHAEDDVCVFVRSLGLPREPKVRLFELQLQWTRVPTLVHIDRCVISRLCV